MRHKAGTIYARAKVDGKIKRQSLGTSDLRIAKIKRDALLAQWRKAVSRADDGTIVTLGDALDAVESMTISQQNLEDATKRYYRSMFRIMRETMTISVASRNWSASMALEWWRGVAGSYAAQRANNVLGMARRVSAFLIERGILFNDPTKGLKRRKIKQGDMPDIGRDDIERTAPVFAGRKIVIAIDSDNPLSTQLTMITGDGWNSIDWTDTLKTGEITHKKSGLVVKVLPGELMFAKVLDEVLKCTFDQMVNDGYELSEEQQMARANAQELFYELKK